MMRNYEVRVGSDIIHQSTSLDDCIAECPPGGSVFADDARMDYVTGKPIPAWTYGQPRPEMTIMTEPPPPAPEPVSAVAPTPEPGPPEPPPAPIPTSLTEMERIRVDAAARVLSGTIIPAVTDPDKLTQAVRTAVAAADLTIMMVTGTELREVPQSKEPSFETVREVINGRTVVRRKS